MNLFSFDAIVVGSGAAGYNAAIRLKEFGKNVAIVTEGVQTGTSRNTGSDKQTYYKLGLSGDTPDSIRKMAEDLFAGGSVDGDNALVEAALSARSFLNLAELGVPFPVNRYGEYVGYKTDHDPFERATSAGPLTSKFMTEALEKRAAELDIPVHDGMLAVEVLTSQNRVTGLLCLMTETGEYAAFRTGNVVLCTGGPAGIYADSVYPECHTGTTSLALLAGAKAQNLTEWQYGLASVAPRWNVSGTYMQVLPRFVSVDRDGTEREFLSEFFADPYEALSMVFLKGYQWPFDSKKVLSGSSVIDLLVYRETVERNRTVYLDYTKNPFGLREIDYQLLSDEAYQYLSKAGALFGTPIERLEVMNAPAIELYQMKGVDLRSSYLPIALSAQHHNGGIAVDLWWQTSVQGLFAAGECAGTHGVTRPGGSALNAGQVGSLRAATYIAAKGNVPVGEDEFTWLARQKEAEHIGSQSAPVLSKETLLAEIAAARRRMSDSGAAIRVRERMKEALSVTEAKLEALLIRRAAPCDRMLYYKLKDILVTECAVLTAMIDYGETASGTRGSSLYTDEAGVLREGLPEAFRFREESGESRSEIQETVLTPDGFHSFRRPVRPIPENGGFFENVWRQYRENQNVW